MAYEATHRYARIGPRKVRPLADMVRGKPADEALHLLRFQPQRGARMLEKVIRSALANAEDRRATNVDGLVVALCSIDEGPMFKRVRPRARGMAFLIKKKFSHIRVALDHPASSKAE